MTRAHWIAQLRRLLVRLRFLLIVPFASFALSYAFGIAAGGEGLITPHGTPRLELVVLGLVTIALRLFTYLVVPALVAYRVVVAVAAGVTTCRSRPT